MPEMNNDLARSAKDASVFRKRFAEYLEESARIIVDSKLGGLNENIYLLKKQSETLRKEIFRILVLGDFNRGKSSLLNALLGINLLPTSVVACTALLAKIKYGKSQHISIYFKDRNRPPEIYKNIEDFDIHYSIPSEVRNNEEMDDASVFPHVSHAEIEKDIDLLENGVEFIDTPGLNRSEGDNKLTLSYIKNCQAIVFVLDATGTQFSMSDKTYLRDYLNLYFLNMEVNLPKVFFVINKWDLIAKNSRSGDKVKSDQEKVKLRYENVLASELNISVDKIRNLWNKRLFATAAERELDNLAGTGEPLNSGVPQLRKALGDFLQNDRLRAEFDQALVTLLLTHTQTEAQLERVYSNLSESKESIKNKIKNANIGIRKMEKTLSDLEVSISKQMSVTSRFVTDGFTRAMSGVINNLEIFVSDIKIDSFFVTEAGVNIYQDKITARCRDLIGNAIQDWKFSINHPFENDLKAVKVSFIQQEQNYFYEKNIIEENILKSEKTSQKSDFFGESKISSITDTPNIVGGSKGTNSLFTMNAFASFQGLATGSLVATAIAGIMHGAVFGPVGIAVTLTGGIIKLLLDNKSKKNAIEQESIRIIKQKVQSEIHRKQSEVYNLVSETFDAFFSKLELLKQDLSALNQGINSLQVERQRTETEVIDEEIRLKKVWDELQKNKALTMQLYKKAFGVELTEDYILNITNTYNKSRTSSEPSFTTSETETVPTKSSDFSQEKTGFLNKLKNIFGI